MALAAYRGLLRAARTAFQGTISLSILRLSSKANQWFLINRGDM